jgi:hypothetical protein
MDVGNQKPVAPAADAHLVGFCKPRFAFLFQIFQLFYRKCKFRIIGFWRFKYSLDKAGAAYRDFVLYF